MRIHDATGLKKGGIGIRVIQWWLASKYSIGLLLWTEPVVGFLHCWLIYCYRCSRSLSKNNRINICWVGSKIALPIFVRKFMLKTRIKFVFSRLDWTIYRHETRLVYKPLFSYIKYSNSSLLAFRKMSITRHVSWW